LGSILPFDIAGLKEKFQLENYIETGTGEGMCLSHAMKFSFKKYSSCEIHEDVFKKINDKFSPSSELNLYNKSSKDFLGDILPTLNGPSFIFLDAHFPGADFHYNSYEDCGVNPTSLPLEEELNLILKYRKGKGDIVLIDDLRIYMDGPFAGGNWGLRSTCGSNKVGFIFDILNAMDKQIQVSYEDQGYVLGYDR